ncbi:uncharacterized protein PRCAT00000780001 [Priceomyces carsonii]|uniref:uncharacterized protein n=1 Tax=Priceomyces carsonii TaxID=28549 RepID=UPI002ED9842E|nr:unnamed protein product [Priceomyces carsonii]
MRGKDFRLSKVFYKCQNAMSTTNISGIFSKLRRSQIELFIRSPLIVTYLISLRPTLHTRMLVIILIVLCANIRSNRYWILYCHELLVASYCWSYLGGRNDVPHFNNIPLNNSLLY